jgi:signal transduction histidine kinase
MIRSMSLPGHPIGRRDVALAALLSMLGLYLMYSDHTSRSDGHASYFAMPVFLLVTLPILWRRAAPLEAIAAAFAGILVSIALFGTITRCGVVFPVMWLLIFAAGARLELRQALFALVLALCAIPVMASADSALSVGVHGEVNNFLNVLPFMVVSAIVWGVGRLVYSRGRLAVKLQGQTEELRRVRDDRARLEVATDRARLSGELEELLHRRLGELALLADTAGDTDDAAATTARLAGIERDSRQTLDEMRALVEVLRDDDQLDGPIAPQPTLTSLDALIVQTRGAGAQLTVEGNSRALPAGVELSAYRIVEHVLGALDDMPGVDVTIRFADNTLEVDVSGPASRRRDISAAIERARERAQLHQGKLEATIGGGRAQAVAELPLMAMAGA